jgi:hypothetical protein
MPDITTAPTRTQPLDITTPRPEFKPQQEVPADAYKFIDTSLTLGERLQNIWTITKITVGLIPHGFTILRGKIMGNLKTTLTGIVGGLASILAAFGIAIPNELFEPIIALTVIVVSWFARDKGNGSDAK